MHFGSIPPHVPASLFFCSCAFLEVTGSSLTAHRRATWKCGIINNLGVQLSMRKDKNYSKCLSFRGIILRVPSRTEPQLPTVVIHISLTPLPSIGCQLTQLTLPCSLSTLTHMTIVVLTNVKCPQVPSSQGYRKLVKILREMPAPCYTTQPFQEHLPEFSVFLNI